MTPPVSYYRDSAGLLQPRTENFLPRKFYERGPRERAALSVVQSLLNAGVMPHGRTVHAPWKPKCNSPISLELRWSSDSVRKERGWTASMFVPCRKCELCLKVRQNLWRKRIIQEVQNAVRSWFVTLTFSPAHLAGILIEARAQQASSQAVRFERAAYAHVQKFLKRLRKNTGRTFRYCAVAEYGEKEGRLHYHLVVHEQSGPLHGRQIEKQWRSITHCRLVRSGRGIGRYVSKYLTKDATSRMRPSLKYGLSLAEKKKRSEMHRHPPLKKIPFFWPNGQVGGEPRFVEAQIRGTDNGTRSNVEKYIQGKIRDKLIRHGCKPADPAIEYWTGRTGPPPEPSIHSPTADERLPATHRPKREVWPDYRQLPPTGILTGTENPRFLRHILEQCADGPFLGSDWRHNAGRSYASRASS